MQALDFAFNRQEIVNMWWSAAIMNVRLAPQQPYWEGMLGRMRQVSLLVVVLM
jgi:hypothetical protein